ncbi:MAG: hypothetical protein CMH57_02650 [Myxococcales bacterium]|nr:hypothetical protein [Myxococcales bacterium]
MPFLLIVSVLWTLFVGGVWLLMVFSAKSAPQEASISAMALVFLVIPYLVMRYAEMLRNLDREPSTPRPTDEELRLASVQAAAEPVITSDMTKVERIRARREAREAAIAEALGEQGSS